MRVVNVVGARPQFIKAAVVSRAIRRSGDIEEILLHTGQHYDDRMSEVFFRELEIPRPDVNLGIGSGPHGQQTGRMLEGLENEFLRLRPDVVLVHGDTNSTLAGALAAAKLHLPVAHVEAGLRSFNRRMPEELNRVVADRVSDFLFAPTRKAVENLAAEGIPEERVHLSGDVMYDAILHYLPRAKADSSIVETLQLTPSQYVLATVHRAENTDDARRLKAIFDALAAVSEVVPVVMPLHPRTRRFLEAVPRADAVGLRIVEPVGYLDMIRLQSQARLIVTDSGGVQKEAFFCGVPCVTLREETEWVELVELGWNTIVPPIDAATVAREILGRLGSSPGMKGEPYGNGSAGESIVRTLTEGL